jgi:predicted AAA+ superfamily ATPase
MLGREAETAMHDLRFSLDELVARWEHYLQIGGFPRAVRDWIATREVSRDFVEDVWDVIHADALAEGDWSAAQSQALLESLARRLTSPINKAGIRRELGEIHNETLVRRLHRLQNAYIAWPCYRIRGNRPDLAAQEKVYFVDALQARLAHERRRDTVRPPDFTQLSEQQIGVALLRARELDEPGTWTDFDALMYYRSTTRSEIDFVGPWLGRVPFEVKYTDGAWRRETQTALAAYGRVVLATRSVLERDEHRVAVPAAILALLLDSPVTAIPA